VQMRSGIGFQRPKVAKGQWLTVVGIVSQWGVRQPYEGGYRLLPRYPRDFGGLPALLPATGEGPVSDFKPVRSGRPDGFRR